MIDLKPFCAPASDNRIGFEAPWSAGPYTYASNGRILVRVPRLEAIDAKPPTDVAMVDGWLYELEGGAYAALPSLPADLEEWDDECSKCDGTGTVECGECGSETDCNECDGGSVEDDRYVLFESGVAIKLVYFKLIAALPGAQMDTAPRPSKHVPFRFEGGTGIVMPMSSARPTEERCIDLRSSEEQPSLLGASA